MKTRFKAWGALVLGAGLASPNAHAFELPKVEMPNLFGGGAGSSPAPGAIDCPVVVIEDGAQMIRSPAGAEAANVHHQVSIKSTARQCVVEGDHLKIDVGIEGDAVLGPAGAPGSYGGVIRIALRRTKDDSIASSKNYRVGAAIPNGAARADFRLLADPILAPMSARPQEDFEIVVGFTEGAADVADKPGRKKKGRR